MSFFEIIINPNADGRLVYYPGEILKGTVKLTLKEPTIIQNCFMLLEGKAKSKWTNKCSHHGAYNGEEVFLSNKNEFLGDKNPELLSAGIHSYDFEFFLPRSIPESFVANSGKVVYKLKAIHERPLNFNDEHCVEFTVERHNNLLKVHERFVVEKSKNFVSLIHFSACKMTVTLPNGTDYAAGEKIPIRIEYMRDNKSKVSIEQTKIQLVQNIIYATDTNRSQTQVERKTLIKIFKDETNEIMPADTSIDLPHDLLKSNGEFCKIVTVEYVLKVEGIVNFCHYNPKLEIPISIGEKCLPVKIPKSYWKLIISFILILILFILILLYKYEIFGNF